jgi:hypothetical protein
MDVWKNTTGSDSDITEKTVKLFIILDSQSDVTRDDTALLVIAGSVSGKFQNLSTQVLQDGS